MPLKSTAPKGNDTHDKLRTGGILQNDTSLEERVAILEFQVTTMNDDINMINNDIATLNDDVSDLTDEFG